MSMTVRLVLSLAAFVGVLALIAVWIASIWGCAALAIHFWGENGGAAGVFIGLFALPLAICAAGAVFTDDW